MASKKTKDVENVQTYKGSQLLAMPKYNSRVARIVIEPNELYSFESADKLISNFMKKKG